MIADILFPSKIGFLKAQYMRIKFVSCMSSTFPLIVILSDGEGVDVFNNNPKGICGCGLLMSPVIIGGFK